MTSARFTRALPAIELVVALIAIAGPAKGSFPGTRGPIAYATRGRATGCPDIFKVNADGSDGTKLTKACPEFALDPSWSADGSLLTLAASTGGATAKLATLRAVGGDFTFVPTAGVSGVRDPSFNDDGSAIVFGGGVSGTPFSKDIYTVSAAGGTPTMLTTAGGGEFNFEPEFSPDGTKIAWTRSLNQRTDVWVMDADGSDPVNLTSTMTGLQIGTSWSPDGTKIAFASNQFTDYEIFTINADGSGGLEQITDESGKDDIQPAFSPDGALIAFTQGCTTDDCANGPGASDDGGIYTTDLNGNESLVVDTANPEFNPTWGTECVANCGPTHVPRKVSMKFTGELKISGAVTDPSGQFPQCERGQEVKIQRKDGPGWATLKMVTTTSTGSYSATVKDRSGTYRATAFKDDRTPTEDVICDQASKTMSHTIVHGRKFVRFFMLTDVDHGGMSAIYDIKSLDAFDDCVVDVTVKIQRKSGSRWVTIVKSKAGHTGTHQGGNLIEHMTARSGTYRAVAPRLKMRGGDHDGDVCKAVTSHTDVYP